MQEQGQVVAGVREGEILAGKYRIDKVLGVGGMGVVVAAHHLQLDDRVAIKFLLPEALANPEAVNRFAREARAAVKIRGEHVARVTDVGTLENGSPYMVMEYLEGTDLAGWIERQGQLPIEQAVEFVLQACEAIAEAHVLGIVHRDLKPANLFVVRRPDGTFSVKVLDFGISKSTSPGKASSDMTQTRAVMGSPLYMSPEQMQSSKDVDGRTDIWALGVILYELLTADAPFLAETMPELVAKILSTPPTPLRNRRPDAPAGIEGVILRCLEKDRGRRYATVGELALALADFAPRRSRASVERISGILKTGGFSHSALHGPSDDATVGGGRADARTAANWGRTSLTQRRTAGITIAAALLGVGLVSGATFAVLRKGSPEPAESATGSSPVPTSLPSVTPPPAPPVASEQPPIASASPPVPSASPTGAAPEAQSPAEKPPGKAGKPAASPARPRPEPTPVRAKPVDAPPAPRPSPPTETAPPPRKSGSDWGGRL